MSDYDKFDDILNSQEGIFGAGMAGLDDALPKFNAARTEATPAGVKVTMHCRGCGKPQSVIVEYPELLCVKFGVPAQHVFQPGTVPGSPTAGATEWAYSQRDTAWFPTSRCSCGSGLHPLFTSNEAEQHLMRARQSGWINPAGEQQIAQHVQRAAAQFRQRMAQGG